MVLTPKDRRLITEAVMLLPDSMRNRWLAWARPLSVTDTTEAPYETAEIALPPSMRPNATWNGDCAATICTKMHDLTC